MFERDLQQLGLSEKEAKVYLAVLELGPATAMQIAQRAELNRPTAYVQIERLMELGLMSSHEKGKKTFYAAEPPERLQELLSVKESEIADERKRLAEILPELQTLFDTAEERPKVRFYERKAGIMAMADDIFRTKNKIILTLNPINLFEKTFSPEERKEFEQIRQKRNIRAKSLYTREEGAFTTPPPPTFEDRFLPSEKFPLKAGIDIYDNKVAAYTLKGKLIGVIVESQEISDTLRSFFELAWEAAEKYQKKQ